MFINLAQVYNRLHQYEDALRCLNQIQHDSPIQTAYSNNVFAETYIGLEQYDKAKELLDEAYDFYHQEKLLETDNAFRNMLGSLEVNLARNEPLEQLTAIRTLYKTLQYEPTHDFKLRLDAIFTALKLQAEMLITSEQYNEAKPLLHEVYCYYLDTLEVSLELKKPTEHVEEAKALHLVLQYEKKDELTQRLHNIIAAIEEPIGLAAQFHSNFTT
ncbi:MAG: hypothetical protein P1U61_01630 [Legionellaceae bacterium]|nr:hypothetical protein [Legionellaceae bacterium]